MGGTCEEVSNNLVQLRASILSNEIDDVMQFYVKLPAAVAYMKYLDWQSPCSMHFFGYLGFALCSHQHATCCTLSQ